MCYFKDITKVENINEIQMTIAKVISSKKENFNYQSIFDDIKAELVKLGVSGSIANSYKIDNMINDTLEQMMEKGNITCFNNLYIPRRGPIKKMRYAFA